MSQLVNILPQTEESPLIEFDSENRILNIKGVCMPENAITLFTPLFDKIDNDLKNINEVNIHLKYLNSMSSKQILRFLYQKNEAKINWIYDSNDELMKMKGEEFKSIIESENFIVKSN